MKSLLFLLCCALPCWAWAFIPPTQMQLVFQERSLYRNILVVEGEGYRCLTFGRRHNFQSCVLLEQPTLVFPYTQAMFVAFYAAPQPRRVLMLGLGGGVIPKAIRAIWPEVQIDTVELDPAVVRVAQTHFDFQADSRSRVHVDDARVFVRRQRTAGTRYDVVLIDAFDKDAIPEHLLTVEFLREVRAILAPAGVVASNTFAAGRLRPYETATYQAVFENVREIDLAGNRIVLAGPAPLPETVTLRSHGRALDARTQVLGFSSTDLIDHLRPTPAAKGIRPFTDQYSPINLLQRAPMQSKVNQAPCWKKFTTSSVPTEASHDNAQSPQRFNAQPRRIG